MRKLMIVPAVEVPLSRFAALLLSVTMLTACSDSVVGPVEPGPFTAQGYLTTGVDVSPPLIWQVVSGVQHSSAWYHSDVTVTWSITEPESPYVITEGCGTTIITEDTAGQLMTCAATSTGGNYGTFVVVKRDATPPELVWSGNEGTYDPDAMINITCDAFDAMAGIALLTNCEDIAAPASSVGPGTHTITAEATDHAGHVTRRSVTFTVTDTPLPEDLDERIIDVVAEPSIRRSLLAKLEAAQAAAARGNNAAAIIIMQTFVREVEAHTPKKISEANGALLINFANALIATLA